MGVEEKRTSKTDHVDSGTHLSNDQDSAWLERHSTRWRRDGRN